MKLWLLRLRISMVAPLLLIYVFVGFGCHKLRHYLVYVLLILTPSYFHEFCCIQKLKTRISMQELVLLDVLILHLFLSLWMV